MCLPEMMLHILLPTSSVCVYGQGDKRTQIRMINAKAEIIVATPGRLNEFVEKSKYWYIIPVHLAWVLGSLIYTAFTDSYSCHTKSVVIIIGGWENKFLLLYVRFLQFFPFVG